jgi:hypothetical protein
MSNTTRGGGWLSLSRAANEASQSPRVIVAALALTGLAASMTLAREATTAIRAEIMEGGGLRYPAGVYRAPYPAIIAPGKAPSGK